MDQVFKNVRSEAEEQRKARIMRDIVEGKRNAFTVTPWTWLALDVASTV
jgi:hypothetical protein